MSAVDLGQPFSNLSVADGRSSHRTEDLLKKDIDAVESPRLRQILQDLCKEQPDPRAITAALLIATEKRYQIRVGTFDDNQDEGSGTDETADEWEGDTDAEDSEEIPNPALNNERRKKGVSGKTISENINVGRSAESSDDEDEDLEREVAEETRPTRPQVIS